MSEYKFYANHYTKNDDAINQLRIATLALGKVLSTPAGASILYELDMDRDMGKLRRDEYQRMIDDGKRPTKKREDARASYESYEGEAYALMNALSFLVVEASGYKCSNIAARRTINYELDEISKAEFCSPARHMLSSLDKHCMGLLYA